MSMLATILVEALDLHAFHGWHPHEGAFGQQFQVDLEMVVDIEEVSESDELRDAPAARTAHPAAAGAGRAAAGRTRKRTSAA